MRLHKCRSPPPATGLMRQFLRPTLTFAGRQRTHKVVEMRTARKRRAPRTFLLALATNLMVALLGSSAAYADLLYALSANSVQTECAPVGTTFPAQISVRAVL